MPTAPAPLLREELGRSLRAARVDRRLTLRELAARSMVSRAYLSEIERGEKEISSELLAALCTALDVDLADLLLDTARAAAGVGVVTPLPVRQMSPDRAVVGGSGAAGAGAGQVALRAA
ncbi:helix-turn-helix domain-containing protein [Nakamurella sp. YIM 132087]|uniref:Helix-turn-helix domain-containing protein n=1 Tax=Nakamurella alba TaxID=2665158 RepID=A0A7K1FQW7_9ACTN|nr:helix-turn-helix transcriptional regulator [Nakamurella alba]MTD15643.1 helix-turn-helix domain-containing protein [Nakamurella alba]